MTLLNQPPAPAAREPRVPIETGRPAGGLGPYEAAYDVAHGYSIERSIVVPRG